MPGKGSIYTLTDPRDGTVRYVGKTTKTLPERLAGHLASPTNPAMRLWLSTLSAQHFVPTITQVSVVSETRLDEEEQRLIRKHARDGARLFNSPYYRQHLGDLTNAAAVGRPQAALLVEAPLERLHAFCVKQMAPIAAARTVGSISRKRVIARVAARSVLTLLYALWRLRIIRYAATGSAAVWYLWTIGFGLMMQQQILPLLPMGGIAAFWHMYLARPLSLIALHAAATFFLWTVITYLEVRHGMKLRQQKLSGSADDVLASVAARALVSALETGSP